MSDASSSPKHTPDASRCIVKKPRGMVKNPTSSGVREGSHAFGLDVRDWSDAAGWAEFAGTRGIFAPRLSRCGGSHGLRGIFAPRSSRCGGMRGLRGIPAPRLSHCGGLGGARCTLHLVRQCARQRGGTRCTFAPSRMSHNANLPRKLRRWSTYLCSSVKNAFACFAFGIVSSSFSHVAALNSRYTISVGTNVSASP